MLSIDYQAEEQLVWGRVEALSYCSLAFNLKGLKYIQLWSYIVNCHLA
jgi:hypothetical protein